MATKRWTISANSYLFLFWILIVNSDAKKENKVHKLNCILKREHAYEITTIHIKMFFSCKQNPTTDITSCIHWSLEICVSIVSPQVTWLQALLQKMVQFHLSSFSIKLRSLRQTDSKGDKFYKCTGHKGDKYVTLCKK